MPDISTLVDDIYAVANGVKPPADTSKSLAVHYEKWFEERSGRKPKTLHFSEVGDSCLRRLWYKVNAPELGETIDGNLRIKFLYGDMLEELVLSLARVAGHDVADEQRRLVYDIGNGWSVTGRLDAIIDGVVVDVKSTTKFGIQKFENGLKDDPFGYAAQLSGYASALGKNDAGFVTIQKELGHIAYFPIKVDRQHFHEGAKASSEAMELTENTLPVIPPVPQSATSKNTKLSTKCSYCEFKKNCFPKMRTFIYSNGPEFLVDVVTLPKVMEVT